MKRFASVVFRFASSVVAIGCGSPDSPASTPSSGGAGGAAGASGCVAETLGAGDTTETIDFQGVTRSYLVHVPPTHVAGKAMPIVMAFHGLGGTGEHMATRIDLGAKADSAGFVAVFPDGIDGSWNGGACCGTAMTDAVDDVGFARAVVSDVSSRLCVDATRVYATGLSNGAFLCHRLACEAADVFAAVAPVDGVIAVPPETCKPSRPVSILEFHGTADLLEPYDGGGSYDLPSVSDTFQGWAKRDACTDGAPAETYAQGMVSCDTYSACSDAAQVTLCTITGGGHCWPGESTCSFGATTADISANDAMWDFFSQFTL